MLNNEQLVTAQKANVEAAVEYGLKSIAQLEKVVALNVQFARAAVADAGEFGLSLMAAKDLQGVLSLQASAAQSETEKLSEYVRQVYELFADANAELSKQVEAQTAEAQQKLLSLVDLAAKNAPAGSESALALVKSTVAAANNAYESAQKAAKQATTLAEANLQALTHSVAPVKAAPKAKRAA